MVIAPHPDDETLATGGLVQQAIRAGAAVRVIFMTDGDDNPWPQRFLERRWRIGPAERQRWGSLRRAEAQAALRRLGADESCAQFLGFPDQGLTRMLMKRDDRAIAALAAAFEPWRPTLLALPSSSDRHPDHSAAWVHAQIALDRAGCADAIRVLEYLVHYRERTLPPVSAQVALTPIERAAKHDAILCHATQVALSRGRFLGYARETEDFFAPHARAGHPVVLARCDRENLRLRVALDARSLLGAMSGTCLLALALESSHGESIRWRLKLPVLSGDVPLIDAATRREVRRVPVRIRGRHADIAVPLSGIRPLRLAFVKVRSRAIFFEPAGWRQIDLPPASKPDAPPRASTLSAEKRGAYLASS